MNPMIPAQPGTVAVVTRVPGEAPSTHPVSAWARVGDRVEALVHINGSGELTPITRLRETVESVVVVQR